MKSMHGGVTKEPTTALLCSCALGANAYFNHIKFLLQTMIIITFPIKTLEISALRPRAVESSAHNVIWRKSFLRPALEQTL